ncbi:hypothetical protein QBC46DRAFT_376450, partial [Diplogelasinospora grovesii]
VMVGWLDCLEKFFFFFFSCVYFVLCFSFFLGVRKYISLFGIEGAMIFLLLFSSSNVSWQ